MNRVVRIGVYKTLRTYGFHREEIESETELIRHLFFDANEWNCFLFMLESKFNIAFQSFQEEQMKTLENVIEIIILAKRRATSMDAKELVTMEENKR